MPVRAGWARADLALDEGLDLGHGKIDQLRQFLQGGLPGLFRSDLLVGQELLEKPLGKFLLNPRDGRRFLPRSFRRDPLVLLGPMFDPLPPGQVTEQPRRGDAGECHREQTASHPPAGVGNRAIDRVRFPREPLDLELQAANLLVELLRRSRRIVVLAGRTQAPTMGFLQLPKLGRLGLVRVGRKLIARQEDVNRLS